MPPEPRRSRVPRARSPIISQSSRLPLPGCNGLTSIPRKICGSAISMIEALIDASKAPSMVLDSATHL